MKGQAALEFLMTYGWAFLIILVMLGVMQFLGVLQPKMLFPERCTISVGFECDDFFLSKWTSGVSESEVSLTIVNDIGEPINVQKVLITCEECTPGYTVGDTNCGLFNPSNETSSATVSPGGKVTVVCNSDNTRSVEFPTADQKYKIKFQFNYTKIGGTYPHFIDGEIFGRVVQQ